MIFHTLPTNEFLHEDAPAPPGEVPRLVGAARQATPRRRPAGPLVYDELRSMVLRQLRRERADMTLRATALVHEACIKLAFVWHPDPNGRNE